MVRLRLGGGVCALAASARSVNTLETSSNFAGVIEGPSWGTGFWSGEYSKEGCGGGFGLGCELATGKIACAANSSVTCEPGRIVAGWISLDGSARHPRNMGAPQARMPVP